MSDLNQFMEQAPKLLEEFGFKYVKPKHEAFVLTDKYKYIVGFVLDTKYGKVHFVYKMCSELFEKVFKEIVSHFSLFRGTLIQFDSRYGFAAWPNAEFVDKIYFKDKIGETEYTLNLEKACHEFERLATGHMLLWFDKYKHPKNIRDIFRVTSEKYQGLNNTNFKPHYGTEIGSIFEMFCEDVILSRLLGDDMRPAQAIYDEFYREPYDKRWSEIDERTGKPWKEGNDIKEDYALLPDIIRRLDTVTEAQWKEYRGFTGIGRNT